MFSNTILILVFNYSNAVHNATRIRKLYEKYFKKIIIYSDIPYVENDNNVNFVSISFGYFTQNVFNHLYLNYRDDILDSDGLFYTMDDNIINVNILNLYDKNKIIYDYGKLQPLNYFKDKNWWWDNPSVGIERIEMMIQDKHFEKYNINGYSRNYSDMFYLPKRYLTMELFEQFYLFGKYNVFMEIAIPTIIHNLEKNENNYNKYSYCCLWKEERNNFKKYNFVKTIFNKDFHLFIHPMKFNDNPELLDWLEEILIQNEKCVIITTINSTTETIKKHINNKEYDVIIVGDNKTPDCYKNEDCIYLDINAQKLLFPNLCDLIPYNHYGRKNLGYLYAIARKYKIIYETDDDNIPYKNFDKILNFSKTENIIKENGSNWINIFKYFTNNNNIWARGYPLSLIKTNSNYSIQESNNIKPAIINGLVENDPDVDALFRLICNHKITWKKNKKIIISNDNVCVFNTQNTFWLNYNMFIGMILPCSVSFRYCDILKSIIANIMLKQNNLNMAYSSPNVKQIRNEHNLINDFKSEYEMYITNENILDYISNGVNECSNNKELITKIYNNLLVNNIITELDMKILSEWLKYFK